MSGTPGQWLKGAIFLLLAFMIRFSALTAENSEIPGADFRFHSKPIHPLLIKQFEPWISDSRPPITVEVNLTAAWDSNEYSADFKTGSNGVVSVHLPDSATYAYQHLGILRDDIHVLRTFDSGGGSGLFEALLFVRFRTGTTYLADGINQGQQVFLRVLRRFPLGDRDAAEVELKQDHVVVGKSRYRENPVVLNFGKETRPAQQKPN
jgi:hypothetical protein